MAKCGAIALALLAAVLLNILGHCEMSVYPGLRRKPLRQFLQQPFDVSSDYLAQLMEENARRRLQQTFEQQLERIHMQMNRQRQRDERRERLNQRLQMLAAENAEESSNEESGEVEMESTEVDDNTYDVNQNQENVYRGNINNGNRNQYVDPNGFFSYKYDTPMEMNFRERIPFAVGPDDPRFFEPSSGETETTRNSDELDSQALDDYQEFVPAESQNIGAKAAAIAAANPAPTGATNADVSTGTPTDVKAPVLAPAPVESTKLSDGSTTTFHRIKPQNAAAAAAVAGAGVVAAMKLPATQDGSDDSNARHHINALIDKLQKEGKTASIANKHDVAAALGGNSIDGGDNLVVRQHLGVDGEMGMYLVALIAGVSAAVTVGLIALGIAWYTLRRKSKAAADVEYPAYGVTGPNKDISPSGDRKLAQSAQMYHYQHQKQQIIAMENRQAAEGSCGMSDVESDDEENEEGDYTVYECPGLAPPMGEMEVKNPLFLDETPVTPSTNITTTTATTTSSPIITNNLTHATLQQPPTQQLGKKPTYKVVVGAAPAPKATSAESMSSEENGKRKKSKK
ncbi:uncharacterized protein LOC105209838 [Zeugodacus cucurbitae]|uniref:uncharacterized protein LOC105209838 n=1 Tax=Zeugodacus cucurbitae TaxID=28588 RepID=UPI0023D94C33|nr:uncharacterized protein LOC105209838 [Zeugodacus cucurbitae]XP_054091188.1 uncharacterized protein LOC105209838 [Zeugodacus cucurbitae]XP_054091189.1 uncharacterized protein LOC105209838 [Zeugodacus cucurbitae]XP_054091190.1 uncharacterized protein LOC105209838 [Zeugodacus cucurbitae]XP_054091191.1 uncharacterized protein LOC105209838 [Zeugodacus cucurbitae]XP_054091192.1 uncharacterized protein LOC105209838 [Zeugodacus cucurbitae]